MQIQEPSQSDITNGTENLFSKKECCGIYGLRNKITNKWYVGQTVHEFKFRWKSYERLKCKKQPKIYRALLKYGYDNFETVVLENCDKSKWILDYREMYWIRKLNSINNGYNITEGGNSGSHLIGRKQSCETKSKISNSLKGYKNSGVSRANKTRKTCTEFKKGHTMFSGTVWINNGVANRRIKKSGEISAGWVLGRLRTTETTSLSNHLS